MDCLEKQAFERRSGVLSPRTSAVRFAEGPQAQLRHSKLEMTAWYMKQIPETVRAAVEKMDADVCKTEAPDHEHRGSIQ